MIIEKRQDLCGYAYKRLQHCRNRLGRGGYDAFIEKVIKTTITIKTDTISFFTTM